MKDKKYAFAGNRAFVLQRMEKLGLNICKIWAVKGSYLEKYLDNAGLDYEVIKDKKEFLEEIRDTDFDIFVSNGLPIILPEEIFDCDNKTFVNIHPSLLPDLRGKDPVPGAILYGRDSGATCHIIDKGIDSGDIISQISIPYTEDLNAGLLYQLSFMAEADTFEEAYKKKFLPTNKQVLRDTDIYYTYKPKDEEINLDKDTSAVIESKVKAFSTGNKGAWLRVDNKVFICENVKCLDNPYIKEHYAKAPHGTILLQYEDNIVVKNAFNELLDVTVEVKGGVNSKKLLKMFSFNKLWFPLIVSVIQGNQTGKIFVNDVNNPTHGFVVNKFGFCQEAYEEYDDSFFESVIRPYIESRNRIKLRMYNPGRYMKKYLNSCTYAVRSTRVHMVHTHNSECSNKAFDYVVSGLSKEDVEKDDFGLELATRYYDGVDDFMTKAVAVVAYSNNGEAMGIAYSAGEGLGVCEKDILVKPKFRRNGIGKLLTNSLIQKCGMQNKLVSEDIYANNDASIALAMATGAEFVAKYDYYNIERP